MSDERAALIADQKARIIRDASSLRCLFQNKLDASSFLWLMNLVDEFYGHQLITTSHTGFYKEVWLAARFAEWRGASHVWLSKIDPPDFWLEVDSVPISFEATEVLRAGRLRDKEVKEIYLQSVVLDDPEANWPTVEESVELLRGAVIKKSGEKYEHVQGLLIYLDVGFISYQGGSMAEAFSAVLSQFKNCVPSNHYNEIWVVYSNWAERIT